MNKKPSFRMTKEFISHFHSLVAQSLPENAAFTIPSVYRSQEFKHLMSTLVMLMTIASMDEDMRSASQKVPNSLN
jgi:hypothetical protein